MLPLSVVFFLTLSRPPVPFRLPIITSSFPAARSIDQTQRYRDIPPILNPPKTVMYLTTVLPLTPAFCGAFLLPNSVDPQSISNESRDERRRGRAAASEESSLAAVPAVLSSLECNACHSSNVRRLFRAGSLCVSRLRLCGIQAPSPSRRIADTWAAPAHRYGLNEV